MGFFLLLSLLLFSRTVVKNEGWGGYFTERKLEVGKHDSILFVSFLNTLPPSPSALLGRRVGLESWGSLALPAWHRSCAGTPLLKSRLCLWDARHAAPLCQVPIASAKIKASLLKIPRFSAGFFSPPPPTPFSSRFLSLPPPRASDAPCRRPSLCCMHLERGSFLFSKPQELLLVLIKSEGRPQSDLEGVASGGGMLGQGCGAGSCPCRRGRSWVCSISFYAL